MLVPVLFVIAVLLALGAGNQIVMGMELVRFGRDTAAIRSSADLDEFKALARRQMKAALLQIVLLGMPVAIIVLAQISGLFGIRHIGMVIGASGINLVLGLLFKRAENRVQTLPVDDAGMQRERDRIVASWRTRPLPDF